MTDSQTPYVDDPTCREAFAETFNIILDPNAGIVRIEFAANRFLPASASKPAHLSPVARVVLSRAGADALLDVLQRSLAQMNQSGTAPPPKQKRN